MCGLGTSARNGGGAKHSKQVDEHYNILIETDIFFYVFLLCEIKHLSQL